MLVSYKWLSEYLNLDAVAPDELADKLSRTGIEVESVGYPAEGLKKLVVGYVESCVPHPNSDHLSICQVNIGEADLSQIVCGAPNVTAGQKVIVALPGARITGNAKIKKGKMRGEVSNGMICSLQELGYSDAQVPKKYANGIYVLPDEAEIGSDVYPWLSMDDAIIELSITPNRADALSMHGVAYEVGAIYQQKPGFPVWDLVEDPNARIEEYITVNVVDPQDVPTYRMRVIKDVTIAESPLWLQCRLMNAGIRPINNIVDVTNYILLEYGQPLHAFDYGTLTSKDIVVRRGKKGEELITLDDEKRLLDDEVIVITNDDAPIGLAGVMGGLDSEITENTTTVALEAALFNPISVRKTSRRFNLRSESSSRFEKGINQATVTEACDRAAALMAELSGGQVVKGTAVSQELVVQPVSVQIGLDEINRALGTQLHTDEVDTIFNALGFPFVLTEASYTISIPPRRWDISIKADILEEVARLYGYDRLPSTLPQGATIPGNLTEQQRLLRNIRQLLQGFGLNEAVSYALTTEEKALAFTLQAGTAVYLQSPMSEDHSVLRRNLISGLLDDLAYNTARSQQNVALYEIGRVFTQQQSDLLPQEANHLAIAVTGLWQQKGWQQKARSVDFYLVKGMLEALFETLGLGSHVRFLPKTDHPDLHPGRTAVLQLGEEMIGLIGQVHPKAAKQYGIPESYVCELNLDAILAASRQKITFKAVSKYPAVKRDLALLVNADLPNQVLLDTIQTKGGRYLKAIQLFDLYQGETIEDGKKSLAYTLTYENSLATLTDEEVNQSMEKITTGLVTECGAIIR